VGYFGDSSIDCLNCAPRYLGPLRHRDRDPRPPSRNSRRSQPGPIPPRLPPLHLGAAFGHEPGDKLLLIHGDGRGEQLVGREHVEDGGGIAILDALAVDDGAHAGQQAAYGNLIR
jgi:hypothetical protein